MCYAVLTWKCTANLEELFSFAVIQGFYGWRVWNLLGHHYLFIVLFTFLVSFTIGTWLVVSCRSTQTFCSGG